MKKSNKIKKDNSKNTPSERDQFAVVLEGIRSDFKVFGESLSGLEQKVDTGFARVEKRLDSHSEMIGQLVIDVSEIKNELKQKVDRDEFAKLEKRVLKLEHPAIA